MLHPVLALRIFWHTLVNGYVAEQVDAFLKADAPQVLKAPAAAKAEQKAPAAPPEKKTPPKPKPPARSEALTLLATLQREARLVDFIKEPIAGYDDAQIGAAVRDIHRDCGKILDRLFDLQPVVAQSEGETVEVPAGFDPGRYRLVGNVTGDPPHRGTLAHHGWEAKKCEIPEWTGSDAAARLVAAAEVELR